MKIFIFNSFDFGSTGTICKSLADAIKNNGDSAYLICGNKRTGSNWDFYLFDILAKPVRGMTGLMLKKFGHHFFDASFYCTLKIICWIKKRISSGEKVIFHFHNMQCANFNIGLLCSFARKHDVKIVYTFHDCWPMSGGCSYWTFENCKKWADVNGCIKCPLKFPNSRRELLFKEKSLLSANAVVVSPCQWMDDLVGQSHLKSLKHIIIYNGIDTNFWIYPFDSEKRLDKINLVAVASPWAERKGLKFLNELSTFLPPNYSLTVVGLSDEDKTDRNIKRIGKVNKESLKSIYCNSDILVNPTLEDNFPTVNIEALLCGLQICSFNTGGSPEIYDNNTGVTCDQKTAESLWNSIKVINVSPIKRSACRSRGLSFSLDKMERRYLALYKELTSVFD